MPPRFQPRTLAARALALALGSVLSLVGAELLCRALFPVDTLHGSMPVRQFGQGDRGPERFVLDEELGFHPSTERRRSRVGTLPNEYELESPRPGTRRVLFLGDSVTERAHLVDAIRERYGEEGFEYWNAGVSGYNLTQIRGWYERFVRGLNADHVVLQIHNNDYQTVPVCTLDENGDLVAITPRMPRERVNTWLFAHSNLYRLYLGRVHSGRDRREVNREFYAALEGLRDAIDADGAELSAIVFPILAPEESWSALQARRHALTIEMCEELGIRYHVLTASLARALADGVDVQEVPGDAWHPSPQGARYLARELEEQGLLAGD